MQHIPLLNLRSFHFFFYQGYSMWFKKCLLEMNFSLNISYTSVRIYNNWSLEIINQLSYLFQYYHKRFVYMLLYINKILVMLPYNYFVY